MPQLAKKAQEIEAALGHSYLDAVKASVRSQIHSQAEPAQPMPVRGVDRGFIRAQTTPAILAKPYDKPPGKEIESFDPQLNPNVAIAGQMAPRPDEPSYIQTFKRGALRAYDRRDATVPIPNAPASAAGAPRTRGKAVFKARPGEAFGVSESGQDVDIKGRKIGYLASPAIVTPYGDVAARTADKQKADVAMGDQDPFAADTLEQMYGPHLKELRSNNGKYPTGYFKTELESAKKNKLVPPTTTLEEFKTSVQKGVKELQRREKEVRT